MPRRARKVLPVKRARAWEQAGYVASRNSGPSPGGISYSLFNATIIAYPPGRSQTLFGKSLPAVHDLIFPGFMDTEIGFCPAWFKPIERPINVRRPASHGRSHACGAGDTAASNMGPGCWHPGASRRGAWSIQVKLGPIQGEPLVAAIRAAKSTFNAMKTKPIFVIFADLALASGGCLCYYKHKPIKKG